ncbi:MAG: hypothetical protein ACRD0P_19805, partial [Stackebrandtia sp.]
GPDDVSGPPAKRSPRPASTGYGATMDYQEPQYDPAGTLRGLLQRGRGNGARQAIASGAAEEVLACVGADWRWDWQAEDRLGYLARLVRDLDIDITPIVTQMHDSPDPDDWTDHSHRFQLAVGTLELLAVDGDREARDALIDYVENGAYWIDALESLALSWPSEDWRGLYRVAVERLEPAAMDFLSPDFEPWKTWVAEHPEIAAALPERKSEHRRRRSRPKPGPVDELLALLRDPDEPRVAKTKALHRLSAGPVPIEFLDLAETLTHRLLPDRTEHPIPGVSKAVEALGSSALGHARRWAGEPDSPMVWLGRRTLSEHGDRGDLAVLSGSVGRLLADGEWCGIDTLVDGMIRIGLAEDPASNVATRTLHQLEWLWRSTPHSHERAAYLRGLIALGQANEQLVEGLWDCQDNVRELAAANAPLSPAVTARLAELRDDSLETDEVRAAATTRTT